MSSKKVIRLKSYVPLANLSTPLKRTYYKLARNSIPLSSEPQLYQHKVTHSIYSIGDNLEEAQEFIDSLRGAYDVEGVKPKDIKIDFVYDDIYEDTVMEVTCFKRETEKEVSNRIKAIENYEKKLNLIEESKRKRKAKKEREEYLRLKQKFEENK